LSLYLIPKKKKKRSSRGEKDYSFRRGKTFLGVSWNFLQQRRGTTSKTLKDLPRKASGTGTKGKRVWRGKVEDIERAPLLEKNVEKRSHLMGWVRKEIARSRKNRVKGRIFFKQGEGGWGGKEWQAGRRRGEEGPWECAREGVRVGDGGPRH